MHAKTKGDIGLLAASLFFAKQGYAVFKEIGDYSSIDLIAEKNGKLIRIQCKATSPKNGMIPVSFVKSGPGYKFKYSKDDFDFMSILDLEDDKLYLVPSSYIDGRTQINLRKELSKNGQTKNVTLAEDFLAEKILPMCP